MRLNHKIVVIGSIVFLLMIYSIIAIDPGIGTPPVIPPCIPDCSGEQCGQGDGCGGTCSDADLYTLGKCGNLCYTDCYCNYHGDCCPGYSGGYSCAGKSCGDDEIGRA